MYLVNATPMAADGLYVYRQIQFDEFVRLLREAAARGELESYIGYAENVALIKEWTGIDVPLNRSELTLKGPAEMLVMKLPYRVKDPATKGNYVNPADFVFAVVRFAPATDIRIPGLMEA